MKGKQRTLEELNYSSTQMTRNLISIAFGYWWGCSDAKTLGDFDAVLELEPVPDQVYMGRTMADLGVKSRQLQIKTLL